MKGISKEMKKEFRKLIEEKIEIIESESLGWDCDFIEKYYELHIKNMEVLKKMLDVSCDWADFSIMQGSIDKKIRNHEKAAAENTTKYHIIVDLKKLKELLKKC